MGEGNDQALIEDITEDFLLLLVEINFEAKHLGHGKTNTKRGISLHNKIKFRSDMKRNCVLLDY